MIAQDLIASSLRLIGVLASGEVPSGPEAADALVILNQMIDSWSAEKLSIFTNQRQVFSLVLGQQAYQMGTGAADFNVARPPRIESASIISLANPAQPLEIPIDLITDKQWQGVPVKNIQGTFPSEVWDDGGFPFRTLSYWPVPSFIAQQAVFYSWTAITQFASLATNNTFPPAYLKAIRYNLALDLAPEFGVKDINPLVLAQAIETKAKIKSINVTPSYLSCDDALASGGGRYNIFSDQVK